MPDLRINKNITIADLESLLLSNDLGKSHLFLPNSIDEEASLGISLAYTQFLLTWARRCEVPVIKTYLSSDDEEKCKRFVQRVHGFSAAYFAKKILPFREDSVNLRTSLLLASQPRIEAMHRGILTETCRHQEVELIFIENSGYEFHGALYSKAPTPTEIADREAHGRLIRSKLELNKLLERIFVLLHVEKKFKKQLLRTDLPFGSLLTEAFKNTAEHGYLQPDGRHLKKNMRCVRIARSQTSRKWLSEFSVSSHASAKAAKAYFGALASKHGAHERENVQMLEISVFDSGAGFSATMGHSQASEDLSEDALVQLCVEKHRSSKPQDNAGAGIYRILSAVYELGGFLRIRTSGSEAFFATTEGYSPKMDPKDFVHSGLAKVEGTLLTIGIPIAF